MNSLTALAVLSFGILIAVVSADFCPGHKIRCNKGQTCCSDAKGSYGCCPYNNATCCSDGQHCCPEGTDCDMEHSRCVKRPADSTWKSILPNLQESFDSIDSSNSLNETDTGVGKMCPDGHKSCPDQYSCCDLISGGYGCCPFKDATCCSDRIHCCPQGQTCDPQKRTCN